MRRLPIYLLILGAAFAACTTSDNWEEFEAWREANNNYMAEQLLRQNPDGTPYFTKLVPPWDPKAYVLIHYFNDRKLTEGNLSPLYTSTVDVKYYGQLYNDEPFDSSYNLRTNGDSIYRTRCDNVIQGWTIALEDMRVGDTCEVVIPWQQGYGNTSTGSIIKPYSALRFGIKLVDIPAYEIQ